MNWDDVLPEKIAKAQRLRERRNLSIRMRECGITIKEMGYLLNCTPQSVSSMSKRFISSEHSGRTKDRLLEPQPIQYYFWDDSDVIRLAYLIKKKARQK